MPTDPRHRRWTIIVCPACSAEIHPLRPDDIPVCFGRRGTEHAREVGVEVEVAPASLVAERDAEIERLKRKLGEGQALLGYYGAGGAAAGLVPAIHNLASRAEKAEAERDALRAEEARADA